MIANNPNANDDDQWGNVKLEGSYLDGRIPYGPGLDPFVGADASDSVHSADFRSSVGRFANPGVAPNVICGILWKGPICSGALFGDMRRNQQDNEFRVYSEPRVDGLGRDYGVTLILDSLVMIRNMDKSRLICAYILMSVVDPRPSYLRTQSYYSSSSIKRCFAY